MQHLRVDRWNEVVKALRKRHLAEGSGYVVQTEFEGQVWLRCTLMNPLTQENDLSQMLDEFESLLPSVLKNMTAKDEADLRMEMEANARRQGEEQN